MNRSKIKRFCKKINLKSFKLIVIGKKRDFYGIDLKSGTKCVPFNFRRDNRTQS